MAVIPAVEPSGKMLISTFDEPVSHDADKLVSLKAGARFAFALDIDCKAFPPEYGAFHRSGNSPYCPAPPETHIVARGGTGFQSVPLAVAGDRNLRLSHLALTVMCAAYSERMDTGVVNADVRINGGDAILLEQASTATGPRNEFLLRMEAAPLPPIAFDEWSLYLFVFRFRSRSQMPLLVNRNPVCEIEAMGRDG